MVRSFLNKSARLATIGVAIGFMGVSMHIIFPSLFKSVLRNYLTLSDGTEFFKLWKRVPIDVYTRFYIFNVTNPIDIYGLKSKPILQEMGPYTFLLKTEKTNIEFNDNGTVTYRMVRYYHFQPDLSNGTLNDTITQVNPVMMVAAASAKKYNSYFVDMMISEMLDSTGSTWFIQKSVSEWLFEGYEDELLTLISDFVHVPFKRFGWTYGLNNSDDGLYNINIGREDNTKRGLVTHFNGSSSTHGFDSPCNKINGSTAEFFPYGNTGEPVIVFGSAFCRNFRFLYTHTSEFRGLNIHKYLFDESGFESGLTNADNKCYCLNDECIPSGATDISKCIKGAPIIVSLPHFLFADKSYTDAVIGLHPDVEKHISFIDIQPDIGSPMNFSAKFQLSIVLEKNNNLPQFQNLTGRIYFPVFWGAEGGEFNDDLCTKLYLALKVFPLLVNIVVYIGIFISIVLIIYAILHAALCSPFKIRLDSVSDREIKVPLTMDDVNTMKKIEIIQNRETVC